MGKQNRTEQNKQQQQNTNNRETKNKIIPLKTMKMSFFMWQLQ